MKGDNDLDQVPVKEKSHEISAIHNKMHSINSSALQKDIESIQKGTIPNSPRPLHSIQEINKDMEELDRITERVI